MTAHAPRTCPYCKRELLSTRARFGCHKHLSGFVPGDFYPIRWTLQPHFDHATLLRMYAMERAYGVAHWRGWCPTNAAPTWRAHQAHTRSKSLNGAFQRRFRVGCHRDRAARTETVFVVKERAPGVEGASFVSCRTTQTAADRLRTSPQHVVTEQRVTPTQFAFIAAGEQLLPKDPS